MFEFEILYHNAHRLRSARRFGALELEAPSSPAAQKQEVQFGPSLRAVEVRVVLAVRDQRLLKGESLPAGPVRGVHRELVAFFQTEQKVQNPAVAQIHLG